MKPVDVFRQFFPEEAVPYCLHLYESLGFDFHIKKPRKTKFGDFKADEARGIRSISVNNNLNPYAFLITYLHEVAHLLTYQQHGRTVRPHGIEWKRQFEEVSSPVLDEAVFPADILGQVSTYLSNPRASSCSDPVLYRMLKRYDPVSDHVFLSSLRVGQLFLFHGHTYRYLEKKRTRILCERVEDSRRYMINQMAEVIPLIS